MVGHGASDGDGDRRQHQGCGRIGNPQGQEPRRQDEARNQSGRAGAHRTGHSQGDPGVQAPAFDGRSQHEAADEQVEHRVGIGLGRFGGVRCAGQWQGDERDQRRGGDRDRLGDPPDQHQGHDRDDPPGLDRQAFRCARKLESDRNRRAEDESQPAPGRAQTPAFACSSGGICFAGRDVGHDPPSPDASS